MFRLTFITQLLAVSFPPRGQNLTQIADHSIRLDMLATRWRRLPCNLWDVR